MRILALIFTLSIVAVGQAQQDIKVQLYVVCGGCTARVVLTTDSIVVEEPLPDPFDVWLKVLSLPPGSTIQIEAESTETSSDINWIEMSVMGVDPRLGIEVSVDGNCKAMLVTKIPYLTGTR